MAPTGWRKLIRLLQIGIPCAALSYFADVTYARADTPLRITGTLDIEASASLRHGVSELNAHLLDDAGHAVAQAEVRVKPTFGESGARGATARACRARAPELAPDSDGTYTTHSDGSGALCVRFEGAFEHAEFDLSFSDPNGLYAPVLKHVVADGAARSVEVAFSPAPSVLALEREEQVLSLATRPEPALNADEASELLALTLAAKREGAPAQTLAHTTVELGSSGEFHVPSRALGGPGPLELDARFAGSATTRAAHASAHVTCTALAELSLAEPLALARPEAGVHVRVRVSSVAGAVPSGAVEARIAGATLGSARVSNGLAELNLPIDEATARAQPLMLRYVADAPWWLPARPLEVEIPISPPSPWPRFGWILAVVLLSAWLFSSWQRPRRLERRMNAPGRSTVRAPVDVIEVGSVEQGWHGRVVDAHDGTPIAQATLFIRLPSFDGQGVLRSAQTDAEGAFRLEGTHNTGPGAALEVRAPWHSSLAAPMPPPGRLVLSLVSRRRTLLGRFAAWTRGDAEWGQRHDPTPGEVARRAQRKDVSAWAGAVDEAAFGPDPLSETKEQAVVGREPSHGGKLS